MRTVTAFVFALVSMNIFGASSVRIDDDVKVVRGTNSFKSNNGKGANRVTDEQIHLEAKLKSVADADTKVEVRWWLFERGIGSTANALKVAQGGSKEINVGSRQVADFKSASHGFHRQEAQSQAFLPGARIGIQAREKLGKNTEGFKFAGYGVQLISGGQVLDSKFSSDDLAAHVGASRNTPGKKAGGGGKK
jgi:hypothetical protein